MGRAWRLAEADLGKVLADAYALLDEGVADAVSPWRTLCLATVARDGGPALRSVVQRAFSQSGRALDMHTDRRSAKYAELHAQPKAAVHGWDPARRVQLRLSGHAERLTTGPAADAAWAALSRHGRATYDVLPGPGTRLLAPDYAMHDRDEAAARAVFAVIRLRFDTLEVLSLPAIPGQGSHKRAVFRWGRAGATADWLVP
jgi:hypothetical protein